MRTNFPTIPLVLGAMVYCAATFGAAEAQSPASGGQETLANVNGEAVTLDDLLRRVGSFHADMEQSNNKVQRPDPVALLDRVINTTLILQDAQAIGLDELPEVTRRLEEGRLDLLRQRIAQAAVKDVDAGDPEVAESLYQDAVREVQVQSVLFQNAEDAAFFEAAIRGGGDFEAQAKRMVQQERATKSMGGEYLKLAKIWPGVAEALTQMQVGETSAPIQISGGLAVVKLLDIRFPEDAAARAVADGQALTIRQEARLAEYTQQMRDRYITVDRELAESLDLEGDGTAGIEAFRSDTRVLAEIKGGQPITVGDLTRGIEQNLFHGMDRALAQKRINKEIPGVIDRLALEQAAELEADRLGITESSEFQASLQDLRETQVFAAFVSRVINPDIRLDEEEIRAYYQDNLTDYTSPEMMRIDGLVFHRKEDAEAAIDKLRQGADMQWMRDNASGQVAPDDDVPTLQFGRSLVASLGMPPGVQGAVAGATADEYRFYGEPQGPFYVLHITEIFPPQPQPYDQVREQIGSQLFARRRQEAVDSYTDDLRAASDIEILANDDRLEQLLGLNPEESP